MNTNSNQHTSVHQIQSEQKITVFVWELLKFLIIYFIKMAKGESDLHMCGSVPSSPTKFYAMASLVIIFV